MKTIYSIPSILFIILALVFLIYYTPQSIDNINKAAYRGDYDKVKCFVENGADLNPNDKKTPLQTIARANLRACCGDEKHAPEGSLCKIAEYLIENGADVNLDGYGHGGPLLIALRSRHYDFVRTLLKYNADVNLTDKFGETPLHVLCDDYMKSDERIEFVKLLIENGADVNKADTDGWPPLFNAIEGDDYEIIHLLDENRVSWDVKDNRGRGPLDFVDSHDEKMKKYIISLQEE